MPFVIDYRILVSNNFTGWLCNIADLDKTAFCDSPRVLKLTGVTGVTQTIHYVEKVLKKKK